MAAAKCCPKCFNDKFVREFVRAHARRRGTCRFCGSKNVALALATQVGNFVIEGIDREYETTEHAAIPSEWADHSFIVFLLAHHDLFSSACLKADALLEALLE